MNSMYAAENCSMLAADAAIFSSRSISDHGIEHSAQRSAIHIWYIAS